VIRPERCLLNEGADVAARERFEGEYPRVTWHHGRAVEALPRGYAPSKHPTKQWPPEALLEVWCSPFREARDCFEFDALKLDRRIAEQVVTWTHEPPATRSRRPATAVVLNANEPPGVDGDDVRDMEGCALDAAFSGRDAGFVRSVQMDRPTRPPAAARRRKGQGIQPTVRV
jgi:hypothetical protein